MSKKRNDTTFIMLLVMAALTFTAIVLGLMLLQ